MKSYDNSQMRILIEEKIHNERSRLVLRLRLVDGWTYSAIAQHPDVDRTERQVANIIRKGILELEQYLV